MLKKSSSDGTQAKGHVNSIYVVETFWKDASWFTKPKQRVESAKPIGAVQPSVLMNANLLQTTLVSGSPNTSAFSMTAHGYVKSFLAR